MTDTLSDDIRRETFRRLISTGRPVTPAELSGQVGLPEEDLHVTVDDMARRGQLRLNDRGDITGAAGLSVEADRHQIDIAGRRFWTWCTYDILGIFGALQADGQARSTEPTAFDLRFERGQPEATDMVLLLPDGDPRDQDCCSNAYEQWCPNANLFQTARAARAWAQAHGVSGHVVPLAQAVTLATQAWAPLVEGLTGTAASDSRHRAQQSGSMMESDK